MFLGISADMWLVIFVILGIISITLEVKYFIPKALKKFKATDKKKLGSDKISKEFK